MDSKARYEDFEVSFEWVGDEKSENLLIKLPGFKKDQIKVQIDGYRNLRVGGERPIIGNRWSRFRKEFRIPESLNMSEIRAKFENETLHVILPKLITRADVDPKQTLDPPSATIAQQAQTLNPPSVGKQPQTLDPPPAITPPPVAKHEQTVDPPPVAKQEQTVDPPSAVTPTSVAKHEKTPDPPSTVTPPEAAKQAQTVDPSKDAWVEEEKDRKTAQNVEREPPPPRGAVIGMSKRRQLLVNVAVAAVVLVVAVAYLSYKLRSVVEVTEGA